MKKYAVICALFLLNHEIVSLVALVLILVLVAADFCVAAMEEKNND